jgi:hypothetical protein
MKYEIITDSEDMLVVTVNSRVISISHDISVAFEVIDEDYTQYLTKKAKAANKSVEEPVSDKSDITLPSNLLGLFRS